jgi:hypothetical protein
MPSQVGPATAPAAMAPLTLPVGALGVGDLLEVAQDAAESGWVQASGRRRQHRRGLGRGVGGEVVGAVGQHRGVGGRHLAGAQGLAGSGERAAEQGAGGADQAGGGAGAQVEAVAQPARSRSELDALVGSGRPTGIDGGQFLEPLALQPVQQPPQRQDPLGPDPDSQPGQVSGGQAIHRCRECRQVVQRAPRGAGPRAHTNTCSSPWRQPINPTPQGKHPRKFVDNYLTGNSDSHARLAI